MSIRRISEQKIRTAIEQGEFNDLDGKCQPIKWSDEDAGPSDHWLAHHILNNAGIVPAWIEVDQKIRKLLEKMERFLQESSGLNDGLQEAAIEVVRLLDQMKWEAPQPITLARWRKFQRLQQAMEKGQGSKKDLS